jgi:hypothetical protein
MQAALASTSGRGLEHHHPCIGTERPLLFRGQTHGRIELDAEDASDEARAAERLLGALAEFRTTPCTAIACPRRCKRAGAPDLKLRHH